MNKNINTLFNILIGITSLAVIYLLIFESARTKAFGWSIALFFLLLAVRTMYNRRKG